MNKNLAYLIGVFLGDGNIGTDKRTFCLQTIDKDFAETTSSALKAVSLNATKVVQIPRKTSAGNQVWGVYTTDAAFCRDLQKKTENRARLPFDFDSWPTDIQNSLIAGLLDSEGYVSMRRVHYSGESKVFDMHIGIGATDVWVYDLYHFLQKSGHKVGAITKEQLKSGKTFVKFGWNKKSFIEKGLYFTIERKQARINEYKRLFPGSTTTRGLPKTQDAKEKMSAFSKTRQRIGGKFVKMGNDIV